MMRSYLIVLAVSVVVTAAVMPLMMRLSAKFGAIAHPSDRKVHAQPTPSLGGGAMYLGLLAGFACAALLGEFESVFESPSNIVGVAIAATVIFATGLVDDIRDVSPPAKVAGMVLAGSILALSGVSIINVPMPLLGFTVLSPDLATLVSVCWVLLMANAVNLIDGLDGLAAGVMAIASGAFLLYSVKLDAEGALFAGNVGPLVAVVTVGVCLGFLFWNFHPAKIFMGDSGALLLGLLMASSTIAVGGQSDDSFTGQSWFFFAPLVMPLLILGVPLIDLAFAVLRRTRSGAGFATADKDHLHHRLMRLGHGHRQTVIIMWSWTGLFSAFALYPAMSGRSTLIMPIALAALLLLVFTLVFPWASQRRRRP
ncbi:MAG: undecaprenyl/decaprenyl-phosphate alpha-N-acetylglucosaminyl 1-phosphate transferase, partial [Microthrixaceae bacterium]|nr:undecaprenyl/decaprenyl-phosphate alpha-N-acetylglucosaminyl 1-phosphate transferase [Microthrixaceae bacterium]